MGRKSKQNGPATEDAQDEGGDVEQVTTTQTNAPVEETKVQQPPVQEGKS